MSSTTLRAYLDELENLMQTEALDEVIGHCRHILQHFPKNVETYRVLGRALLDKSRFVEAGDVFQRVLSVYPSDFVAHLGMSNVSEEQGQVPAAAWHLERAFEQDPNNPALHDELKRLMDKRDGSSPERIQLTRGGLAHLYAKGRLYDQAVLELQGTLAQMPERVDLWLLLAQVLWESERPVEAADVALRVLEHLPNSVEANRIMADLWLRGGRPSDAAPFVNRLEQLDPFMTWQVVNTDGKPLPPNAFQLPRLDWDARAAAALTSDVPDWVNAIGNVFDEPQSVSLSGGVTDWLAESAPAPAAPPKPAPQPSKPSSMLSRKLAEAADETPDWFKESQSSTTEEVPDWFKESTDESTESTASGEEIPDWFRSDAPSEPQASLSTEPPVQDWFSQEAETAAPTQAVTPSWLDDSMPSLDDLTSTTDSEQMPSGFTDLLAGSAASAGSPPSTSSASVPDWLADVEEPATTSQALDAMSWLTTGPLPSLEEAAPVQSTQSADDFGDFDSFFGESTAVPETQSESAIDDDPLSWLQSVPSESGSESGTTAQAASVVDDDPLGWMNLSSTEAVSSENDTDNNAEPLGWFQSAQAETPLADQPESASDSSLDWLSTTTEPVSDEDPLGWMNQGSESVPTAFGQEDSPQSSPATQSSSADPLGWMRGYDNDFTLEPEQPSSLESALAQDLGIDLETHKAEPERKLRPGEIDVSELNLGSLATTALPANSLDWLNEDDADEDDDADQWLSKFMPGSPASTPPASASPAAPPTSQTSIELEDDWLASFESTSFPTPAAQEQEAGDVASWLSSTEAEITTDNAEVTSTSESWFGTLEESPAQSSGVDDFFSTLGMSQPANEFSLEADLDLDATDFSTELDDLSAEPAGDMPDWMRGMAPPAQQPSTAAAKPLDALDFGSLEATNDSFETTDTGKRNFEGLIKSAGDSIKEPRPHIETGVLDPGTLPDWLTGVEESAAPVAATGLDSLDDFDFDSGMPDQEPAAIGEAPDWLSNMAPAAQTQASAPKSSFDDLDFGSLDTTSDMPEAGDTPDWLSNMAPAAQTQTSAPKSSFDDLDFGSLEPSTPQQSTTLDDADWLSAMDEPASVSAPVESQPSARFDMPATLPEIDFSDLDNDGIPDVLQQGENSFSFNRVAQSSESMNTSGETGSSSFSFKQKQPAWKKKSSKGSGQAPSPQKTSDDFSDWLTSDAFGSDESDNSDPDWLK